MLEPPDGPLPEPEIHARLVARARRVRATTTSTPLREAAAAEGCDAYAAAFGAAHGRAAAARRLSPRSCSTRRSARRCPTARRPPPRCGASPSSAPPTPGRRVRRAGHRGRRTRSSTGDHRSAAGSSSRVDEHEATGVDRRSRPSGPPGPPVPELLDELARARRRAGRARPRLPVRALGRRAPALHGQHDHPRPGRGARPTPTARCASAPTTPPTSASTTARWSRVTTARALAHRPGRDHRPTCAPATSRFPTATASTAPAARDAPNELTSGSHRDAIAGTPLHKHVPARVERVQPGA